MTSRCDLMNTFVVSRAVSSKGMLSWAMSMSVVYPILRAVSVKGGVMIVACTFLVCSAATRAVCAPICSRVTSFSGLSPTLASAIRTLRSVALPKRLTATFPPTSCSTLLISGSEMRL